MGDKKYYVQTGKSVTSKKGILKEGTEVFANYFHGDKSINELLEAKIIGDVKPDNRTKAEIVAARETKKREAKKSANSQAAGATKKSLDEMNLDELLAHAKAEKIDLPKDIKDVKKILEIIKKA